MYEDAVENVNTGCEKLCATFVGYTSFGNKQGTNTPERGLCERCTCACT